MKEAEWLTEAKRLVTALEEAAEAWGVICGREYYEDGKEEYEAAEAARAALFAHLDAHSSAEQKEAA